MPKELEAPNFLYIGAPKAGSSWLFEALRAHPDVFVPDAKDIQFFDKYYDKGWHWYQNFFQRRTNERAVGEISHDYFFCPEAASRIHKHIPQVRLICCLREPGDLILSGYRYARNHAGEFDIGLQGYSQLNVALRQIDYLHNLRHFYDLFPSESLYIAFYDDLNEAPDHFIARIYRFLGVDDTYRPAVLHRHVNVAKNARFPPVAKAAYKSALILRKAGLANLVGAIKRNPVFDRLIYRGIEKKEFGQLLPDECSLLATIRAEARATYPALADLIGQDLPAAWSQ